MCETVKLKSEKEAVKMRRVPLGRPLSTSRWKPGMQGRKRNEEKRVIHSVCHCLIVSCHLPRVTLTLP